MSPRFEPVGTVEYNKVTISPSFLAQTGIESRIARPQSSSQFYASVDPLACIIVKIYPGVNISYLASIDGLRSVLIVGLGSGNGPISDESFSHTISVLLHKFVFVAVASDCLEGDVLPTYSTSIPVIIVCFATHYFD